MSRANCRAEQKCSYRILNKWDTMVIGVFRRCIFDSCELKHMMQTSTSVEVFLFYNNEKEVSCNDNPAS